MDSSWPLFWIPGHPEGGLTQYLHACVDATFDFLMISVRFITFSLMFTADCCLGHVEKCSLVD